MHDRTYPYGIGASICFTKIIGRIVFSNCMLCIHIEKITILPIILVTCLKHDIMNSVKLQE